MKTKYIFKSIALSTLISLSLTGCNDFLDTTQRGVTPQENFYQTDAEALQALYAIYDKLQSSNLNTFEYKNILSDDAQAGGGGRSDNSTGNELNEFDIPASNTMLKSMFTKYYEMIYCCNILLKNVKEASDT